MSNINIKIPKAKGEFQIRKWKNDELVYDSGLMNNVVVNNFYKVWFDVGIEWDYRGNYAQTMMNTCAVSTDSVEVDPEDTNLSGQVSTKTFYNQNMPAMTIETIDGRNYYKVVKRYLWNQGDFDNVTLSKVGVFSNHGGGITNRLMAGQLFRNSLGHPLTLTVKSDEQLDITYTLYVPVLSDVVTSDTMIINSVEYPYNLTVYLSRLSQQASSTMYRGNTLLSSPAQVLVGSNTFIINSTAYAVTTATKTMYDDRMEIVYTMIVPSGPEFNPINSLEFGNLFYNYQMYYNSSLNLRLIKYEFTGGTKPIKLVTDTYESTVKIVIGWEDN